MATTNVLLIIVSAVFRTNTIVIYPNTTSKNVLVSLIPDPRDLNMITTDNHWKLRQESNNPLYDWYYFIFLVFMSLEKSSFIFSKYLGVFP